MSKNIEDIFKSSLENHEEAYDPNAWESLSKKLDLLNETKPKSNTKTWKFISIATISVAIGGYFLFQKTEIKENNSIVKQEKIEKKTEEIILNTLNDNTQKKQVHLTDKKETKISPQKINVISTSPSTPEEKSIEIKIAPNNFNNISNTKKILQVTSRELYCQGEKEEFKNQNEFTIYLIHHSGKSYAIKREERTIIELVESGNYYWSFENTLNTENKMFAFEVINTPKLNFNIPQDLDFSEGLPKLSLSTNNIGLNKWYLNDQFIEQGNNVDFNIFNKGSYQIKLVNENNGCKSELRKWFNSEENYNLLSVTGIDPNHSDSKRNSFIPYALLLRNTDFRMIILSPNTGEIIFETNDIEKPWKGQNQKTNELVPQNSEYIWKVILNNPVKGEKSEYKGRITRI